MHDWIILLLFVYLSKILFIRLLNRLTRIFAPAYSYFCISISICDCVGNKSENKFACLISLNEVMTMVYIYKRFELDLMMLEWNQHVN